MIHLGNESDDFREEIWIMCKRDPLFWLNTFGWTFDPRKHPSTQPFITYEYQDEAILEIWASVAVEDILIKKSRDMGASWINLVVITHLWQFYDFMTFLLVSRKEDLVDNGNDPDCLFWKIKFLIANQPGFLQPTMSSIKLNMTNIDTGSTIDGSSTTGDVGRGGRRTAIMLDEFAAVEQGHDVLKATRDNTRTRLFNSTPKGMGNAYYDMTQQDIKTITMHWSRHPEKAEGLYTSYEGTLEIKDREYPFPEDYNFILDEKLRSPWYDLQCKRAAHSMEIAQELDIDFLGSDYQFFDEQNLKQYRRRYEQPPVVEGRLEYDSETAIPVEFTPYPRGFIKMWVRPDHAGKLDTGRSFCLGVDISFGTGATNSVISGWDRGTREKVLEVAISTLKPHQFARMAVAIARWMNGALLGWESNGPGRIFGDEVLSLGYRNIYYKRSNEDGIAKKFTDIPGFSTNASSKLKLLGGYQASLAGEYCINRSKEALNECSQYVFTQTGQVMHVKAANNTDPSGARDNHGDRVIADAIGDMLCRDSWKQKEEEEERLRQSMLDVNSLMGRRLMRQEEERRRKAEEFVW